MPGDVSFIDIFTLLPRQPWQKNLALWKRWQTYTDTYGAATARAMSLGATFAEFGYTYSALLPANIDAVPNQDETYSNYFGDDVMPARPLGDVEFYYDIGAFVFYPDLSDTPNEENWIYWAQTDNAFDDNNGAILFYGMARVACRMFQLEVARELLTIFG